MNYEIDIVIDTDGVTIDFWNYIMEKALYFFKKIDKSLIINGYNINNISNLSEREKQEFLIKYIELYNEKFNDIINIKKYEIKETFNCSSLKRNIFWLIHIFPYCLRAKFMEGAVESIKSWQDIGIKVHNNTARVYTTNHGVVGTIFRYIHNKRYKNAGVNFDSTIYGDDSKRRNDKRDNSYVVGANIGIEDYSLNVELMSKVVPFVLCYDEPHNKKDFDRNVLRVVDYQKIKEAVCNEMIRLSEELKNRPYIENGKFKILTIEEQQRLSRALLFDYYKELKKYYQKKNIEMGSNKDCNINYRLTYIMSKIITKTVLKRSIVGKQMIPYSNNTGGIYVINKPLNFISVVSLISIFKGKKIIPLINKNNLSLKENRFLLKIGSVFYDKQNFEESIETIITLVSKGKDVLVSSDDFPELISKITRAPIVPILLEENTIIIGETRLVLFDENIDDAKQLLSDSFHVLSQQLIEENNNYKTKKLLYGK